jgi:ribonuclease HI
MQVHIWCDGAAMPNPGPAGAGYVIVGDARDVRLLGSDPLGYATNNTAEYTAVRNALQAAADKGATRAHVRMDSLLVIKQLLPAGSKGSSECRAKHLVVLRDEVREQVGRYAKGGVTFQWIPREKNGVADALAEVAAIASKKKKSTR